MKAIEGEVIKAPKLDKRKKDKPIDWARVGNDYCAGIKTLRTIAKENGIAESYIRRRAEEEKWKRDVDGMISREKKKIVRKQIVRERVPAPIEDDEVIAEGVARVQAQVLQHQREDVLRLKRLARMMILEMELACGGGPEFKELSQLIGDGTGAQELRQAYKKAQSFEKRIDGMRKITEVFERLIKLERQAYNIKDEDEPPPPADATESTMIAAARMIAFALAAATAKQ